MANENLAQVETDKGSVQHKGEGAGHSIRRPQLSADVAESGLAGDGEGFGLFDPEDPDAGSRGD